MKENIRFDRHGFYPIRQDDGNLWALVLCQPSLNKAVVIFADEEEEKLFHNCAEIKMSINEAKVWLAMQKALGWRKHPAARRTNQYPALTYVRYWELWVEDWCQNER